jgi:hypothetical protein
LSVGFVGNEHGSDATRSANQGRTPDSHSRDDGQHVTVAMPLNKRWRRSLRTFMPNFVAYEDVAGVLPGADVDEPKRCVLLAHEDGKPFAEDQIANHQMDFINQIMRQQIVPEGPAAGNQNVIA